MQCYLKCCVANCNNIFKRDPSIKFYKFPNPDLSNIKDPILRKIMTIRQKAWLKAVNCTILNERNLKYQVVCSRHFISGHKSSLWDISNPDWTPSINLPNSLANKTYLKMAKKVYELNPKNIVNKKLNSKNNANKSNNNNKNIKRNNIERENEKSLHDDNNKIEIGFLDALHNSDSNVSRTENFASTTSINKIIKDTIKSVIRSHSKDEMNSLVESNIFQEKCDTYCQTASMHSIFTEINNQNSNVSIYFSASENTEPYLQETNLEQYENLNINSNKNNNNNFDSIKSMRYIEENDSIKRSDNMNDAFHNSIEAKDIINKEIIENFDNNMIAALRNSSDLLINSNEISNDFYSVSNLLIKSSENSSKLFNTENQIDLNSNIKNENLNNEISESSSILFNLKELKSTIRNDIYKPFVTPIDNKNCNRNFKEDLNTEICKSSSCSSIRSTSSTSSTSTIKKSNPENRIFSNIFSNTSTLLHSAISKDAISTNDNQLKISESSETIYQNQEKQFKEKTISETKTDIKNNNDNDNNKNNNELTIVVDNKVNSILKQYMNIKTLASSITANFQKSQDNNNDEKQKTIFQNIKNKVKKIKSSNKFLPIKKKNNRLDLFQKLIKPIDLYETTQSDVNVTDNNFIISPEYTIISEQNPLYESKEQSHSTKNLTDIIDVDNDIKIYSIPQISIENCNFIRFNYANNNNNNQKTNNDDNLKNTPSNSTLKNVDVELVENEINKKPFVTKISSVKVINIANRVNCSKKSKISSKNRRFNQIGPRKATKKLNFFNAHTTSVMKIENSVRNEECSNNLKLNRKNDPKIPKINNNNSNLKKFTKNNKQSKMNTNENKVTKNEIKLNTNENVFHLWTSTNDNNNNNVQPNIFSIVKKSDTTDSYPSILFPKNCRENVINRDFQKKNASKLSSNKCKNCNNQKYTIRTFISSTSAFIPSEESTKHIVSEVSNAISYEIKDSISSNIINDSIKKNETYDKKIDSLFSTLTKLPPTKQSEVIKQIENILEMQKG